jgi:hypothetical protein
MTILKHHVSWFTDEEYVYVNDVMSKENWKILGHGKSPPTAGNYCFVVKR